MQYRNHRTLRISTGLYCLVLLFVMTGQPARAIPNGGYANPEVIIQPEELKSLIDRKDPNIRIIDVRSAHSLVSLYLAGYPLDKLHNYDGSWIEWSRSREPMETGP